MANDKYICSKCGAENEVGSSFCKKCGADLHAASAKKPSNWWYLLPILLGLLGGIIGYIVIKVKDKKMAKNILYVGLGTFVLGIILIAAVPSPPPEVDTGVPISTPTPVAVTPTVAPTPTPTPSIITVTARELCSAYEANEIAADAEYEGKIVKVSGVVDSIGKDILDTPYITLEGGKIFGGVQCMFDEKYEPQLAQLAKGERVTVQGRCSGYLIGTVLIRDCILE
mgnify:CR=1 FL=1